MDSQSSTQLQANTWLNTHLKYRRGMQRLVALTAGLLLTACASKVALPPQAPAYPSGAPGPAPSSSLPPGPSSARPSSANAPSEGRPTAGGPTSSVSSNPGSSAKTGPAVYAPPKASLATDARAYRKDAAAHVYERNQGRIYKGMMPPLLYAIGVLEVEIDRRGTVVSTEWKRAPTHAPEVIAEIEKMVLAASPFPAPSKLGRVVYTDTWLWDQSGQFQLDTLTEGQR